MRTNSKIKFYWDKLPLKESIYTSFGISVFLILMVFVLQGFLPPQVPLFYGEPVGENQLVLPIFLSLAPLFALTMTLINTFIASKIKDDFTQKVLIVSSLFISILSFITLLRIIFLVGIY